MHKYSSLKLSYLAHIKYSFSEYQGMVVTFMVKVEEIVTFCSYVCEPVTSNG